MKLILIKSWTHKHGRKYPIGQKLTVDNELGAFLLERKYAKEHDGDRQGKVRTDFFKTKD